jgi:hypothetical protein
MAGWNLPPGCSLRDIENAMGGDDICEICGLDPDECECPECGCCGRVGDLGCYGIRRPGVFLADIPGMGHGMRLDATQLRLRAEAEERNHIEDAADAAWAEEIRRSEEAFDRT